MWSHFPTANLSVEDARTVYVQQKTSFETSLGLVPSDRVQEKLFVVTTPEVPPPPATAAVGDYVAAPQQMIQGSLQQSSRVLLATESVRSTNCRAAIVLLLSVRLQWIVSRPLSSLYGGGSELPG